MKQTVVLYKLVRNQQENATTRLEYLLAHLSKDNSNIVQTDRQSDRKTKNYWINENSLRRLTLSRLAHLCISHNPCNRKHNPVSIASLSLKQCGMTFKQSLPHPRPEFDCPATKPMCNPPFPPSQCRSMLQSEVQLTQVFRCKWLGTIHDPFH